MNLSPLYTFVSKNAISEPHTEDVVNISLPNYGFNFALADNAFSIFAMKIFAKAKAILVPIAVPWVCR